MSPMLPSSVRRPALRDPYVIPAPALSHIAADAGCDLRLDWPEPAGRACPAFLVQRSSPRWWRRRWWRRADDFQARKRRLWAAAAANIQRPAGDPDAYLWGRFEADVCIYLACAPGGDVLVFYLPNCLTA